MPQQQRMHMNRKGIKQQIIESTKQQQLEKKLFIMQLFSKHERKKNQN